jgi:chromosomal replication initiator protein
MLVWLEKLMTTQESNDVRLLKSVQEIWTSTQEILAKKMKKPTYEAWIRPLQLLEIRDGEAIVGVANDFMRSMVTSDHIISIKEALLLVTKETFVVRIVIDASLESMGYTPSIGSITVLPTADSNGSETELSPLAPGQDTQYGPGNKPTRGNQAGPVGHGQTSAPGGINRANLNTKYTFDTFVVGSHNRFSYSAAMAVAERPGQAYSPLFIYGGVGLGKTHIMQGIGHEILKHRPNLAVRYITCERFTNELINSIRDDRMMDFRKRYRQVDVLMVDDIQFIQGKESTQEEFFHTFNALREGNKQIVLSSDRPPKAISHLEERLRSRFEWGLIADIQAPDLETRVAILRKKCDVENIKVSDDVLEYIANVFTTNIRELEGALIRVHAYASLAGSPLTPASLAGILQPVSPAQKLKNTLTIERITDTVASYYRVESSELRSSKRSQDLALPRHVAMYLGHELMQMSFPRIGQSFGNRKHTSVLYACQRIKEAMDKDGNLSQAIKQITAQLGA